VSRPDTTQLALPPALRLLGTGRPFPRGGSCCRPRLEGDLGSFGSRVCGLQHEVEHMNYIAL